ncbi:hypothetical protein K438DRAFT_1736047 [Mycena galopus ATCC 62051]|nr:hypothetical protein K438DRAFT_1736047 [Mycena galopus ATCC 62051]
MSEHSTSDFVKKLYLILDNWEFQELIDWGPEGDFFIVKDVNGFSNSVLPRIYKHSNFASFVRQLNKYDFHKIKTVDEDSWEEKTWAFRHPDFRRDGRDTLENIKRKSQRKSSAPTALDPLAAAAASSSQQVEIQNNKIIQLESQLTALGAAHRNVLTGLRTLEHSNHEVILEMIGLQRNLAQQDGLLRALLQYLWRDNTGISSGKTNQLPANESSSSDVRNPGPLMFLEAQETQRVLGQSFPESDVARATLQQMSELSRQAQASGIYFPAIESGGTSNPPLGVSGTGAAMDGFHLTGVEKLQVQLQGNATSQLDDPLSNPVDITPRNVPGATRENLGDLEDEVVLPTPTSPPISEAQSSRADTWTVSAGDAHAGLDVFTVGHLMPRGTGETGSGSFENGALVGNQEVSGDSAQTLRVRRSTFVPGWAVPPRVLLVDDDAVTRKLSSKFLKIFGCTTDIAVDGVSAVNKMNLEKYDLVLMDIVMPKMDGISATSMIRKFDPKTPIISMTSSSRPTEIMTYFSSGMNDILPKPFTRNGLLDVLEKHLAHLTVIKQQMATSMIPRPPTAPPSNDMGFGNAFSGGAVSSPDSPLNYGLASSELGDGQIDMLAGMGITDEEYNRMLMDILGGSDESTFELTKRQRDADEEDERGRKRSRFEVAS